MPAARESSLSMASPRPEPQQELASEREEEAVPSCRRLMKHYKV